MTHAGEWSPTRDWTSRASHFDHLLFGDPADRRGSDPEAESVRSHPSSHAPDQALLRPHSPPPPRTTPARAQTQRLQRRRNQFYYENGLLVPVPPTGISGSPTAHRRSSSDPNPRSSSATQPDSNGPAPQQQPKQRSKPYLSASGVGSSPSWLLSGAGGERRESRKLQKEHPVGSARPSCTVEIPEEDSGGGGEEVGGERDGIGIGMGSGVRGSVLGVRRRMEKLRGLYRRGGEKEGMVASGVR